MNSCNLDESFVPENFIILNFCKNETCFLWSGVKLVIFPYPMNNSNSCKTVTAPERIKTIQRSNHRIYILCSPSGIYRLLSDYSFARLSMTGIGIFTTITNNYQILSPRKNILCVVNKHKKHFKQLFYISPDIQNLKEICIFHLYINDTDEKFRRALLQEDYTNDCCLIANGRVVFKLVGERVQVIYNSDYIIGNIVDIRKVNKICAIAFVTETNVVIFVYPEIGALKFEKVFLNTNIRAFCAGISRHLEDSVWMIYSDDIKTYHLLKKFNSDSVQIVSVDDESLLCLRIYKCKELLCLSDKKSDFNWLVKVSIEAVEKSEDQAVTMDLVNLNYEMMNGMDQILEKIYERALELKKVNTELQNEQDLLKRLNMFMVKRRIQYVPRMQVYTLSDHMYVVAEFQKSLPQNSQVVLSLKLKDGSVFAIKSVDSDTKVVLPIFYEKLNTKIDIQIDSIIVKTDNGPWCLIKDFIKDPEQRRENKHSLDKDKLNFLTNKMSVLRKLIRDRKIDMKTLSDIKKSIRRELADV